MKPKPMKRRFEVEEEPRSQSRDVSYAEGGEEETAQSSPGATKSASDDMDAGEDGQALFESNERDGLWQRWSDIQSNFVDDPERSVAEANVLVSDLTERLVGSFRSEQTRLQAQWERGDEVSTEELRVILQRYRTFFDRLLQL
jgi:hypothetical protein